MSTILLKIINHSQNPHKSKSVEKSKNISKSSSTRKFNSFLTYRFIGVWKMFHRNPTTISIFFLQVRPIFWQNVSVQIDLQRMHFPFHLLICCLWSFWICQHRSTSRHFFNVIFRSKIKLKKLLQHKTI